MGQPFIASISYYPARLTYRQADTSSRLRSPYTGAQWTYRQPGNTLWDLEVDFPAASPAQANVVESSTLVLWGAEQGPQLYWWPETLAAPAGTVGTYEVESVALNNFEITFKSSSLTSGQLGTGQWIVIEGVLYRVMFPNNSTGKTTSALIFPAYRGRVGGTIDWAMTNFAKAPRWELLSMPELTRDESGILLPWRLNLRQIPYATFPF